MKRLSICWIIGCLLELVACRPEVPTQAEQGETDVFPDYREVTVPVNMDPPNFKLVDQQLPVSYTHLTLPTKLEV